MEASRKPMLTATCHCKAIRLTFPTPNEPLNECLCTICRRYGGLWAYFTPDEARIEGQSTDTYIWNDRVVEFHRCQKCGCMSHWLPTDMAFQRLGINCRMLERADLEKLGIRKSDGP